MINSKQIAITGIGRSGTTFLSSVLHEAGWDFGPEVRRDKIGEGTRPVGGGMEHPVFVSANNEMIGRDYDGKLQVAQRALNGFGPPCVVKDPRFLDTMRAWWNAGYRPDEIIVCLRHWKEIVASYRFSKRRSHPTTRLPPLNNFLCWTSYAAVPLRLVLFPHVARNADYANRVLAGLLDHPATTVRDVWESDLCHF